MRHETTLRYVDAIARHRSIRRAADALALTPSALNRRLLALEEEIGAPLFERQARGVRLSAAGEMFVHHARRQMAEMGRVRAAIEDMKGARRGHVTLALDRAVPPAAIAALIAAHRTEHPGVTFEVVRCGRAEARPMLESYAADLALAVEPEPSAAFSTLATAPVRLLALVAAGHDLDRDGPVRLSEALAFPLALPSEADSARFVFEGAAMRHGQRSAPAITGPPDLAAPLIRAGGAVGIALGVGMEGVGEGNEASEWVHVPASGIRARAFHERDVRLAHVHLGQLRDRTLPVPAARFANAVQQSLARASGEG